MKWNKHLHLWFMRNLFDVFNILQEMSVVTWGCFFSRPSLLERQWDLWIVQNSWDIVSGTKGKTWDTARLCFFKLWLSMLHYRHDFLEFEWIDPLNPDRNVSIKFIQINTATSRHTMAASGTAVTVLTPNGRRQTVKVSPNTPLLQVTGGGRIFNVFWHERLVSRRSFVRKPEQTVLLWVSLFG